MCLSHYGISRCTAMGGIISATISREQLLVFFTGLPLFLYSVSEGNWVHLGQDASDAWVTGADFHPPCWLPPQFVHAQFLLPDLGWEGFLYFPAYFAFPEQTLKHQIVLNKRRHFVPVPCFIHYPTTPRAETCLLHLSQAGPCPRCSGFWRCSS